MFVSIKEFTLLCLLFQFTVHAIGQNSVEVYEHYYDNIFLYSYTDSPQKNEINYSRTSNSQYKFEVYPGGDPQDIFFEFTTQEQISLLEDGSLLIQSPEGTIREQAPKAYQLSSNGQLIEIPIAFYIDQNRISLKVGTYELVKTLHITINKRNSNYVLAQLNL